MVERRKELHAKSIALMLALWFFISWWQIVLTNSDGAVADVSWWNMFHTLGILDANASEEMAYHEEHKAVSKEQYMNDLDLLARLIYAEGGGASWVADDMCYGIGSVALNRVESEFFPSSLEEVIYQQGQYACVNTHWFYEEPNERSLQIADELLNGGSIYPDNVLFQAEFTQGSGVYQKIQNMYFCWR